MKVSELRELGAEGLKQKSAELKEELFNLKFQHAIGKLENTATLKVLRGNIARIETVKNESTSKEG